MSHAVEHYQKQEVIWNGQNGEVIFFQNENPYEVPNQVPGTVGVRFHDLLTVFLTGSGGIQSVINGAGAAVSSSFGGPSDAVSYP